MLYEWKINGDKARAHYIYAQIHRSRFYVSRGDDCDESLVPVVGELG